MKQIPQPMGNYTGEMMMKKKVLVIVLVSTLFGGVVSAASLWGSYKGNDIIRITSNGTPIQTKDVPAISYDGRTMIPISMLGQVGIKYSWNQQYKTVDIISKPETSKDNVDDVILASLYKYLEDLGEELVETKQSYDLSMMRKIMGDGSAIVTSNSRLNVVINNYNRFIERQDVKKYAYYNDIKTVLDSYYKAIDNLKEADIYISALPQKVEQSALDRYSNIGNSFDTNINAGLDIARKNFTNHIYKAIK